MPTSTITYSTEMMSNRIQAQLITPQKKFEALQAADGHSLLFSIASDGDFYLTREHSGKTTAGWAKTNLSADTIKTDFKGKSDATVRTFEAAQNVKDQSIGLAMVVRSGGEDRLYLALGQSNDDLKWSGAPKWEAIPYDNPDVKVPKLEIAGVFFCETFGGAQYIVVDIVREPGSVSRLVSRYYIDPTGDAAYRWVRHDLPVEVEAETYRSCVGRADRVDGMYTVGQVGKSGQLIYQAVVNAYGDGPAPVIRLSLPGDAVADAIATTRGKNELTDLFVVSGKQLFYFANGDQRDQAVGTKITGSPVLSGTVSLTATVHDKTVTLWGKNGSNEVYYLRCPSDQLTSAGAWSNPVPILSDIETISPFVNLKDGGNTIFAAGGGNLTKVVQEPTTDLWATHAVTLPAPPTAKSLAFNSYTTTVFVADATGQVASGANVGIKASRRCSVYINNLYYNLEKNKEITAKTDAGGSVTIIEASKNLNGVTFTVASGGASETIDPMAQPFKLLSDLDSESKLREAGRTIQGKKVKLVRSDADKTDLQAVARSLGNLKKSHASLAKERPPARGAAPAAGPSDGAPVVVSAGDLFRWLNSEVDAVVKVIEDAATDAWHFVATIAGKMYTAALDTVDAVVGAVEWAYTAIKTGVEDLIQYVSFLFEWDDIKRTQKVMKNLLKRYLEDEANQILEYQKLFDGAIATAEGKIGKWAGLSDWSGLGEAVSKTAGGNGRNPNDGQTSGSQSLISHFKNNASDLTVTDDKPPKDVVEKLLNDLLGALEREAKVLGKVVDEFSDLAKDFAKLSVEAVLKRVVGIFANGMLSSVQVVADTLFKILFDVASSLIEVLDTKIHIPVVSDLLETAGIPEFSLLDVFCLLGATAYTVVNKIATGKPPFEDNAQTKFLQEAKTFKAIEDRLTGPTLVAPAPALAAAASNRADKAPDGPSGAAEAVYIMGHVWGGGLAMVGALFSGIEAMQPTGNNDFTKQSGILAILSGATVGLTNVLAPRYPIEDKNISALAKGTLLARILCKILFSGPVQGKLKGSAAIGKLAPQDGRAVGAVVDAVLVIPALCCTIEHFVELGGKKEGAQRSAAIVEEVSNLASYVSRIAYAAAVNTKDTKIKAIEVAVMSVANVAYAGLQVAEGKVNWTAGTA